MRHKIFDIVMHCSLLMAIVMITTCEREKITDREHPRIDISDQVRQEKEGVIFEGKILSQGSSEILETGFIWGSDPWPNIMLSKSTADQTGNEIFTAMASTDLFEGQEYYVRAYVRTDAFTVYSKEISFICTYNKPPAELLSFAPDAGMWNDTISIYGRYLSFLPTETSVFFGETESTIISCSDTLIRVTVPPVSDIPSLKLKVRIYKETCSFQKNFSFLYPVVEDYFPKEGCFQDTLCFVTSGLPDHPVALQVTFNEINSIAIGFNDGCFKVLVPDSIQTPTTIVTANIYGTSYTFDETFKLKPPEIHDISPPKISTTGEVVKISGSYFNPEIAFNSVYMDDIQCEIMAHTGEELLVKVPINIVENPAQNDFREIPTTVAVAGQISTPWALILEYQTKWTQMTEYPGGQGFNSIAHAYNGKAYYGLSMAHDSFCFAELWEYDPEFDSWKQKQDFPGDMRLHHTSFIIGDRIFLCCGTTENIKREEYGCLKEVWEYNIIQDTWTRLTDFPGIPRHSAFSFSIGGKGYLGGGNYGRAKLQDFWEYDPVDRSWSQKKNIPEISSSYYMDINTFQSPSLGYTIGEPDQGKDLAFWEYDPDNDTWTRLSDYPALDLPVDGFYIDGYIYAGSFYHQEDAEYDCYRYSIEEDIWTPYLQPAMGKVNPDALSINSKGYILGGKNINIQSHWELDPEK